MKIKKNVMIESLPTYANECLQELHHICELKTREWQKNGRWLDHKETIQFQFANSPAKVRIPLPTSLDLIPVFEDVFMKEGVPQMAILAAEVHCKEGTEQELAEVSGRQIEDEFMNDPGSNVWRAIYVHGIDMKTGNQYTVLLPFGYDDRGQPLFGTAASNYIRNNEAAQHGMVPALLAECRNHVLSLGA
jgi:hypothetical protein